MSVGDGPFAYSANRIGMPVYEEKMRVGVLGRRLVRKPWPGVTEEGLAKMAAEGRESGSRSSRVGTI
jgi:hypothetical protein